MHIVVGVVFVVGVVVVVVSLPLSLSLPVSLSLSFRWFLALLGFLAPSFLGLGGCAVRMRGSSAGSILHLSVAILVRSYLATPLPDSYRVERSLGWLPLSGSSSS